ncbi:MAG: hypothetical protein EA425_02515 [Puniceicoccaceae bacterium]|nr:MAG: hypothetical protein EA425_02515 [Puniceicoccaceae bacterium]
MKLHLLRHAHAVTAAEDPERPLSAKGRRQAETLAAWLGRTRWAEPAQIWHSPLARSRESAEALLDGCPQAVLREVHGLEPADDPADFLESIQNVPNGCLIVGHEPHLSHLASLLLFGHDATDWLHLRKAGWLTLSCPGNTASPMRGWCLDLYLTSGSLKG